MLLSMVCFKLFPNTNVQYHNINPFFCMVSFHLYHLEQTAKLGQQSDHIQCNDNVFCRHYHETADNDIVGKYGAYWKLVNLFRANNRHYEVKQQKNTVWVRRLLVPLEKPAGIKNKIIYAVN